MCCQRSHCLLASACVEPPCLLRGCASKYDGQEPPTSCSHSAIFYYTLIRDDVPDSFFHELQQEDVQYYRRNITNDLLLDALEDALPWKCAGNTSVVSCSKELLKRQHILSASLFGEDIVGKSWHTSINVSLASHIHTRGTL